MNIIFFSLALSLGTISSITCMNRDSDASENENKNTTIQAIISCDSIKKNFYSMSEEWLNQFSKVSQKVSSHEHAGIITLSDEQLLMDKSLVYPLCAIIAYGNEIKKNHNINESIMIAYAVEHDFSLTESVRSKLQYPSDKRLRIAVLFERFNVYHKLLEKNSCITPTPEEFEQYISHKKTIESGRKIGLLFDELSSTNQSNNANSSIPATVEFEQLIRHICILCKYDKDTVNNLAQLIRYKNNSANNTDNTNNVSNTNNIEAKDTADTQQ